MLTRRPLDFVCIDESGASIELLIRPLAPFYLSFHYSLIWDPFQRDIHLSYNHSSDKCLWKDRTKQRNRNHSRIDLYLVPIDCSTLNKPFRMRHCNFHFWLELRVRVEWVPIHWDRASSSKLKLWWPSWSRSTRSFSLRLHFIPLPSLPRWMKLQKMMQTHF